MKKYIVYKHTNLINNKIYIGITGQTINARWQNGNGYKNTTRIGQAIKKYGWNNFKHEILFSNLSKEEAENKEVLLIKQYDSTNPDKGYNSAKGGVINADYYWSEDSKKRMSEISKERGADPSHILAMKKENIKPVRCIETNLIYESANAATLSLGYKKSHISEAAKGTRKTACGYHWEYITDQNIIDNFKRQATINTHSQYDINKNYKEKQQKLKEKIMEENKKYFQTRGQKIRCIETNEIFESINEAERQYKCKCSISAFFAGRQASAGKNPLTGEKLHWEKI